MDDAATYTFKEEELDETEMTEEEDQWPSVGHWVSPLEREKSMLVENGRYDNSDHQSGTGSRNELDESVHKKGTPRRRAPPSKKMEKTTFHSIDRAYNSRHYDRCRGHLYKDHGYYPWSEWLYAKVVLFEDHDCDGRRHEFEIDSTHAPAKKQTRPPP